MSNGSMKGVIGPHHSGNKEGRPCHSVVFRYPSDWKGGVVMAMLSLHSVRFYFYLR